MGGCSLFYNITRKKTDCNNILTKAAEGVPVPNPSLAERGKLMTTYEEFMIILAVAGLIVAIPNLKNK